MKAKGESAANVASKYQLSRSTITTICKSKHKINNAFAHGCNENNRKIRMVKNNHIEDVLMTWYKQVRSQNVPVNGLLLQTKAKEIADKIGVEKFQASNGWLEKFLKRYGLIFKKYQGEKADIIVEDLLKWQKEILNVAINKYSPEDIFNVDETGLFWQMMPNKTLAFKGERCSDGKKAKSRVTILIGANMTGKEKLPLLVIGKYAKPRCFKNANIPIEYTANTKAWITSKIFESWLKKWDEKLIKMNRKILLFMNNCSAHCLNLKLNNIEIQYFMPNTTALAQPMDQGVIQNFKIHYRNLLILKKIESVDRDISFSFNILDALHFFRRAWDKVTEETIKNCFKKAKFWNLTDYENDDYSLNNFVDPYIWDLISKSTSDKENITFEDYVLSDQNLYTEGMFSIEELVENSVDSNDIDDQIDVTDKYVYNEKIYSVKEIYDSFDKLKYFLSDDLSAKDLLKAFDTIDDYISIRKSKNAKQKILFDYNIKKI